MKSLGITLNSFWGSHGSTQGMLFEADRLVPHIPTLNIMYRKKALEQESGFDENFLRVCEDPELNFRLTEAGGEILFKHDASVIHKMRPTLKSWFRNVELYGFGRIEILKKHPSHLRLMWLVPIALVLGLTASIALATVWPVAALIPCGYFAFVLLLATQLCAKAGELSCIPMVFAVLSWNPIAYGWGQIRSLLGRPVQF